MTEAELNKLLFDAYLFGQRVLYASVDLPKVKAADDKTWDTLKQIVDGEATAIPSAAEMLLKTPMAADRVEAMKEYLARVTPKLIERDKAMARRILDGANQTF